MAHPRVDITQLSPEERLDLIEELWESLRETTVVTAPQRDELAERIAALEHGERATNRRVVELELRFLRSVGVRLTIACRGRSIVRPAAEARDRWAGNIASA